MINERPKKLAQPTVTVVIPCYNTHIYLGQAIESVRMQTFPDIETIVVDDGSTDPETIAFLDRLGSEVKLIRQKNRGLPAARNTGFIAARGDFVLPLDADDWLESTFVEKHVALLVQRPELAFTFSYIHMKGEGHGVLHKSYNFFEQLFLNQLPYCLMLRKSVWKDVGGYDETMRSGYEDWEFNIRLGSLGYFGEVIPEALFNYRILQSGMLLGISSKIHGELWETIRGKHREIYGVASLVSLWRVWLRRSSTYPLWLYPLWLVVAKLLPKKVFASVFMFLRRHSHGRRVTAAQAKCKSSDFGKLSTFIGGKSNRDQKTIEGFDDEWKRFDQRALAEEERTRIFADYFVIFPWDILPADAVGADIGCGSGRWALLVAPRVGKLHCVDPGDALEVAQNNLVGINNVQFHQCGVGELPFADESLDFAYSLGVLHHVPDTAAAIHSVAAKLKSGAPFLIYLYYAFDNRPAWFSLVWRMSDIMRRGISRLPHFLRYAASQALAALVYWPLAKGAWLFDLIGLLPENWPLAYYRDKTFYVMRTDALDRFGTHLEQRFTREQITNLLTAAGFDGIHFSDSPPYWCAVGVKSSPVA